MQIDSGKANFQVQDSGGTFYKAEEDPSLYCVGTTQMFLIRGKTGEVLEATEPLEDIWWPSLGYSTEQWLCSCLLFGSHTPVFSLAPYYAQFENCVCHFYRYQNGSFDKDWYYIYPSCPSYDAAYVNDQPNAYGQGHSYMQYSHVNNGLFVNVSGQDRLLFFTIGRVVQYAVEPFGPYQLLYDYPHLNGGRTDLAGRHYGSVQIDPAVNNLVTNVAGSYTNTVYTDMKTGTLETDPAGSIERHVTIYDFVNNSLDHRFFSYCHDGGWLAKSWEGRVVYPKNIYAPTNPGQPSRLFYNVLVGGHWYLHISEPGSTTDKYVLTDLFCWDIIELNGVTRCIISPSTTNFPLWQTGIYTWHEDTLSLTLDVLIPDAIPHLQWKFREGDKSTSHGWLYPVLTVYEGGQERLLLERQDGTLFVTP